MLIVSHEPARAHGVPVARLCDYDRISTESLPVGADRCAPLQWFWEPSHDSKARGDIFLARIFGSRDTGDGVAL